MPCDVLVVAAFDPELARIREVLGGRADRAAISAGEVSVVVRAVGIGLPMAAAGSARAIAEVQPRAVVALGTCGAYRGRALAIGDVVVATSVLLTDPSVIEGRSQFPGPMSLASDAEPSLAAALQLAGARAARIATTLSITVDESTAARIAQATGAEAEHLEAHAVATACEACKIPFGAVLGVANYVGSTARDEWREHNASCASAAAEVVVRWLRALAIR
ncbi:MAG: hypothetical protein M3O50_06280 [Myxococcota bacterium]|nr:hypothetical protein [Myxococcota bacterium]